MTLAAAPGRMGDGGWKVGAVRRDRGRQNRKGGMLEVRRGPGEGGREERESPK